MHPAPTPTLPRRRTREAGLQLVATANGDHARTVARAKDREKQRRERLQQLARSDRQSAKEFQRLYLNSYEVILAALAKANEKYRQKHRLPPDGLVRIAQEINAWVGTDEPVRAEMRQKSGGGQRPIAAFGIRNKALQIMAHRAVEPFANLSPYQYAVRGKGPDAACHRIIKLLKHGYTHVLLVDVADNFNSMGAEGVVQMLPLPERITRAVALAGGLNYYPRITAKDIHTNRGESSERRPNHRTNDPGANKGFAPNTLGPQAVSNTASSPITIFASTTGAHRHGHKPRVGEVLRKVRKGIPQGSAFSSLVSEILHAPIVRKVSERAPVVHYVDDYHVFARTEDELLPIAETLQAEFSRHPSGPLLSKQFIIKDARQGFVALGYQIKVKNGRVSMRPPRHKLLACTNEVTRRIGADPHLEPWGLDAARTYVQRWCNGHRLWPHVRLWERLLLARLDSVTAL